MKTIAGGDSDVEFRHAEEYAKRYDVKPSECTKKAGRIDSDKYSFDIHWVDIKGEMKEQKIKNMRPRKK